jgi:opacity protein-like surface antigen
MRVSAAVLITGLLWAAATGPASAQALVNVRGHAGASWFRAPEGQSSLLDPGTEIGFGLGWDVYRGAEVTLEGAFAHFAGNENELALSLASRFPGPSLDASGGDVFAWTVAAGLRYTFRNPSAAHPYVAAAVTYSAYRAQSAQVVFQRSGGDSVIRRAPRSDIGAFGYQSAVGVSFQVSRRAAVFVEPRLAVVRTQEERDVLECEGADCRDAVSIGALTRSDESTVFVPVRIGIRLRPWTVPPPAGEQVP